MQVLEVCKLTCTVLRLRIGMQATHGVPELGDPELGTNAF